MARFSDQQIDRLKREVPLLDLVRQAGVELKQKGRNWMGLCPFHDDRQPSLVVTPAVANLIRENKTFRINSAIQTGAKFGMNLMDDNLFDLWIGEKVEMEDVLGKAHDPDALAKRIATARRQMMEIEAPAHPGGPAAEQTS